MHQIEIDQRQLRWSNLEPYEQQDISFIEFLPYSHFRKEVPEKSIYVEALNQIPALSRLTDIKCLSFLSYVGPGQRHRYFSEFSHSRLDHTLTVALITEEILKQNKFPQDQINLGIVAALLHDIATPAYGDATKQVDMKNLHEEDHWWEVLDKKAKDFILQFGTQQAFDDIIKNKGILGEVLDISDRITYTMKDLYALRTDPLEGYFDPSPYFRQLKSIISRNKYIGDIYKTVKIDEKKQEVYFSDPEALDVFLNLRAHLHQKLYMHPINQAKDLFVSKVIAQMYSGSNDSILYPDKLRKMTDNDLMHALGDYHHTPMQSMHPQLVNWDPKYEIFNSIEEAKIRENELKQKDNIAVIGVKDCKGFNPATSYKVMDKNKVIEFREYNLLKAKKIEGIAKSTKNIYLFWTDISKDSFINNLLRTVLNKTN